MQKILIIALRFYQRAVSPHLKYSCKFYPTCSEYAICAIKKHGSFKGILKTVWRLLRCNPLSRGGTDFP
ncbi:MAG: membrane protein insertion efficiency factor YidD [Alphaproteobacteria bacterium]|nr:membrane protein insertion efficiency factor YidD [Alphaproteobacteria bacterium]MBO7537510.1 membrane protein insertion efficiency factor YidD [Alphaproteobacteria bacterium]MBO7641661.1 membrane protein insertion efficiency factor YidD [Alphaproteobacteria bacterium]